MTGNQNFFRILSKENKEPSADSMLRLTCSAAMNNNGKRTNNHRSFGAETRAFPSRESATQPGSNNQNKGDERFQLS